MNENLQDKTLQCLECGAPFIWTASEQAFYLSKGLIEPKRCLECRAERKRSLEISRLGRHGQTEGKQNG